MTQQRNEQQHRNEPLTARPISRRQLLRGMAVTAGGLALTACTVPAAPGAAPAAGEAGPDVEPVVVSFTTQGNENELAMFDALVEGFEETHPGITIDKRYDPTMDWPKAINMLRTGTASDVQRVNDDSVFVLAAAGLTQILDDYFDQDLERDDYYDIIFEQRTGPGGTIASAYVTSAPLIAFFNMDLMEEAGLEPPTQWVEGNWDMVQMEEAFAQLLQRTGERVDVYPFFAPYWQILGGIYNVGIDFWSEDETESIINQPEALEVVRRWQSWFEKDYFVPVGEDENQLFNSGLLAIKYDYSPFAYDIPENIRWRIGPTWGGQRIKTFQAGRNFAMPTATEHKQEAWEFMKYMLSRPGQEEFAKLDWGVPVLKEVAEGPVFLDPNKPFENHHLLPESLEIGSIPWPSSPASEAFMIPFRLLDAVNTGEQAPEDFLVEADEYLTGILQEVGWSESMDTPDYRMSEEAFERAAELE